jgi:hypothetical protein
MMMIDSPAPIEIWEEAFNNADYLHQRYQSEGGPREIAIKALMPGTDRHPTAIQTLIHHANDTDKDCAMMIYSETPNEFGEEAKTPNKFGDDAVKHYKECDSYHAPITRLLFITYSNSDTASYQR